MNDLVLAADLGGTNLRMSSVDRNGRILFRTKNETPRSDSPDAIVSAISNAAKECIHSANSNYRAVAIAIAVPAAVDVENGIVINAPNLQELNGFQITSALEYRLSLPCILENDANAAAIGENLRGASREFEDSICITLGTGVGGGIILGGKILRGVDGTAGEIGHICVEPFGVKCGCGGRGCLEQYASASAVIRMARDAAIEFPGSALSDHVAAFTSKQIFEAGKNGDALALKVFKRQGFYLGIALAGLINVLNPEVIVIGGGAAAGWELFIRETESVILERTFRRPRERAKIARAETGDDAGVLGVAHLAFENAL